jgi:hypothetical protein
VSSQHRNSLYVPCACSYSRYGAECLEHFAIFRARSIGRVFRCSCGPTSLFSAAVALAKLLVNKRLKLYIMLHPNICDWQQLVFAYIPLTASSVALCLCIFICYATLSQTRQRYTTLPSTWTTTQAAQKCCLSKLAKMQQTCLKTLDTLKMRG